MTNNYTKVYIIPYITQAKSYIYKAIKIIKLVYNEEYLI